MSPEKGVERVAALNELSESIVSHFKTQENVKLM